MRSFLRVCRIAGFNKKTGQLYWSMFFKVLFRNPKGIEAAINLAAMFIHFQKQKEYVVFQMNATIQEIENEGEASFYKRIMVPALKDKVEGEIIKSTYN
jgi:hypothetical protein